MGPYLYLTLSHFISYPSSLSPLSPFFISMFYIMYLYYAGLIKYFAIQNLGILIFPVSISLVLCLTFFSKSHALVSYLTWCYNILNIQSSSRLLFHATLKFHVTNIMFPLFLCHKTCKHASIYCVYFSII